MVTHNRCARVKAGCIFDTFKAFAYIVSSCQTEPISLYHVPVP